MSKQCSYCQNVGHSITFCYSRPKNSNLKRKAINKLGKHGQKWLKTRSEWFKDNQAEYYTCYLCGKRMTSAETTLDHVKSRSRAPELRYDFSNLRPSCYRCNQLKGSRSVENFKNV